MALPNFYHKDLTRLLTDFDKKIHISSSNKKDQMESVVQKMKFESQKVSLTNNRY
jgi:hypothetical protein